MAIMELKVKPHSRSKGLNAVRGAAYRLGLNLRDEATGLIARYAYRQKRGAIIDQFTVVPLGSPPWAHDPEALWNAAERAESRVNSVIAREIVAAFPHEVSADGWRQIARGFAEYLGSTSGLAVSVGIHAADAHLGADERNTHGHFYVSTRRMTDAGFGEKAREWDDIKGGGAITAARAEWARLVNQQLAQEGFDVRIDHRSLAELGIERERRVHLGPDATALERQGIATDLGNHNRNIDQVIQQQRLLAEARREEEEADLELQQIAQEAVAELARVRADAAQQEHMWRAQLDKTKTDDAERLSEKLEGERRRALELEGLLAAERRKSLDIENGYLHELDTLNKVIDELSKAKDVAEKALAEEINSRKHLRGIVVRLHDFGMKLAGKPTSLDIAGTKATELAAELEQTMQDFKAAQDAKSAAGIAARHGQGYVAATEISDVKQPEEMPESTSDQDYTPPSPRFGR